MDYYNCKLCKEVWHWCPVDYEDPDDHDHICPLCHMDIKDAFKEVYNVEGLWEAVKWTAWRIKIKIRNYWSTI